MGDVALCLNMQSHSNVYYWGADQADLSAYEQILTRFSRRGGGHLYRIPAGSITISDGYHRERVQRKIGSYLFVPIGLEAPARVGSTKVGIKPRSVVGSILSLYEIACIRTYRQDWTFDGRVCTHELHSVNTHFRPPQCLHYLAFFRNGVLRFGKEYAGVSHPDMGVLSGVRLPLRT
jgi:hypothetical protein